MKGLDEMSQTLQWSASLGAGILLGILNWAFWKYQTKRLIGEAEVKWGALFVTSFLKLGVLGTVIWFLLSKKIVEPIPFLVGLTVVVVGMLIKGLK